ncbi:MAG: sulfatase [Myxococcota bacterium]
MFRLTAAFVLLCSCQSPAVEPEPPSAPPGARPASRALLITIDTLRADVLGAYGGPALTPELDAWARSGWRFNHTYSASMLTNPSHSSILTSLYPRDHGVYDNRSGIADSVRTLPGELRRQGISSGAVVAFPHLNPNVANLARGFDRFVPATRNERRAHEQIDLALTEIDSLGTDRFFFWLHMGDPHAPYDPILEPRSVAPPATPIQTARQASPGFQRKNPWFRKAFAKHAHAETFYDLYVAEVEAVDRALASLRQRLQARGLWDELLVVVTSDHGEGFGEHGMWFHHGGLYDQTIRVPLIIRGPRVDAAVDDRLVEHVDIAPTLAELMGAPRWEPMRGRSLFAQRQGVLARRKLAFSEHMLAQAVAVRDGEWLQVLHRKSSKQFPSYPFVAGSRELWRRTPHGSMVQVRSQDFPDEAARLGLAIETYLGTGLTLHARRAVGQDEESLRALGYIE